jgi:hypothetical protein
VIIAAAFCPHPPLLVPAIASGASPELDDLRAACRAAITRIATPGVQLVVLGAGPSRAAHDAQARGSFAGFGVKVEVPLGSDEPGPVELPLALTVGAWLLRDALGPGCGAIGYSIGPDGDENQSLSTWAVEPDADVALLVMGDGSARRSPSAPGYFDPRAEAFDAGVAVALRSGQGELLHIDPELGADLLASGPPAWDEAAWLLEGRSFDAELLYDAAPYGVGYFVATWTLGA